MREHLQLIRKNSELIYERTNGRDTITRNQAKILQSLFDEMQFCLDEISNELQRAELDQEDDDFDRRHAYPICDD